ncbi:hypothetical protein BGX27_009890 [Mortierella sp. AM989]|nr:hypothetical protein BGX27_009890 [Mortierella sp. AM989]
MSLLRNPARRSFNVALSNNLPAVTRLPLIARTFSSSQNKNKEELLKHAPGWKDEHASESEAIVKADREPHYPDLDHLQRQSVEHLKGQSDDAVQDLKDKAQAVGDNVSEHTKEYAHKAKEEVQKSNETLVDGVKIGAEKVTKFVKESVDTAKKAVGMDK